MRTKYNNHKTIKCRSFKKYTSDKFALILKKSNFCNYEEFDNIDSAYNDFADKLIRAINKIAPSKEIRVKGQNQEWFDGEILDAILYRDECLEKFKKSMLREDEISYKESKYFTQDLIISKKRS